jgi:hypothetical protein
LEGRVPLHAQITRGGIYCEHANVLEGTPSSFSSRVARMRQLSGYIPAQVGCWLPCQGALALVAAPVLGSLGAAEQRPGGAPNHPTGLTSSTL